jgi:hypothetical protein
MAIEPGFGKSRWEPSGALPVQGAGSRLLLVASVARFIRNATKESGVSCFSTNNSLLASSPKEASTGTIASREWAYLDYEQSPSTPSVHCNGTFCFRK